MEGHDYFFRVFANGVGGPSEEPAEVKPAVRAKLPYGNSELFELQTLDAMPINCRMLFFCTCEVDYVSWKLFIDCKC